MFLMHFGCSHVYFMIFNYFSIVNIFFFKKQFKKIQKKRKERERYSGGDKWEMLLFLCGIKVRKKKQQGEEANVSLLPYKIPCEESGYFIKLV